MTGRDGVIAAGAILALSLLGCDGTANQAGADAGVSGTACGEGGDPFAASALRVTVEALADPALLGRDPGTAGDRTARAYVARSMRCLGLEVIEQAFDDEDGDETANVVGVIRGTDPDVGHEIIVIGAHHDHLGEDASGIYRGANDNGSGVAVLLAVAQGFAVRNAGPARTLVFAAFGAEEQGYLGSQHYADAPPSDLAMADTVFMLNLDMVGSYDAEGVLLALHTFEGTPGREALEALAPDFPQLDIALGDAGEASDHLSFCEAGVPTTFFFTEESTCYHQTCDTPDRIDWPNLAAIASLTFALVDRLAGTDDDLGASRAAGCGEP